MLFSFSWGGEVLFTLLIVSAGIPPRFHWTASNLHKQGTSPTMFLFDTRTHVTRYESQSTTRRNKS